MECGQIQPRNLFTARCIAKEEEAAEATDLGPRRCWGRAWLHCTVLYCIVLYCIVLYCTVLYCTVLYCTVLYCAQDGGGGGGLDGGGQLLHGEKLPWGTYKTSPTLYVIMTGCMLNETLCVGMAAKAFLS